MSSRAESIFEGTLLGFRFLILIVVIALLLSSLVAFFIGILSSFEAFTEMGRYFQGHKVISNAVIVSLISAIDEFLLGIVMIIIALGVYELFISKFDSLNEAGRSNLSWLKFHSLEELKGVLTKVILIILMVYFFKNAVSMKYSSPQSLLYLAGGIVLIAFANFLNKSKPESHKKY